MLIRIIRTAYTKGAAPYVAIGRIHGREKSGEPSAETARKKGLHSRPRPRIC